jgi:hypothetical protein
MTASSVKAVQPASVLVLGDHAGNVAWAFVLEPIDETRTRLLVRASGDCERFTVGLILKLGWRPIHFGMQRRQLLNLKWRAEATAR